MLNWLWVSLILGGILIASWNGRISLVTEALFNSAGEAVGVCFDLIGLMALWLGILEVAREAGLVQFLAKLIRPLARLLFPEIPPEHPALGAIIMNLSANILGLGNAATPFGLKAMEELQKLNPRRDTASDAMCTFLAANTSCVTLIPATIIGVRVAAGSHDPAEIVGATIFATGTAMVLALTADYLWRTFFRSWLWGRK